MEGAPNGVVRSNLHDLSVALNFRILVAEWTQHPTRVIVGSFSLGHVDDLLNRVVRLDWFSVLRDVI